MEIADFSVSRNERGLLLLALIVLFLLTGVAIAVRPMTPIDETRYIGVAWEMWLRGDFLVPFKNGAPYSHKPPLMIWLFQAGWAVFGVNEWWPRLVSPLVSAGNLLLTLGLVKRLWRNRDGIGGASVLILSTCLLWTFFSTSAMFDIILAFFTLLGMHGTLLAAEGRSGRGIVLLGAAIGFGVLAKGPVILLHVLPVALLTPWWSPGLRWLRWFGGIFVAVLLGAAVALIWAIPAGIAGGEVYRRAIFWGQTADRMVESFAHRRPLWWYLPILPAMFMPWFIWPGLWRALSRFIRYEFDRGGRFCLAWLLPVIIVFSFISGKQPHYLIPIFPAFALLAARALVDEERVKGLWLPFLVSLAIGGGLSAVALGWLTFPMAGLVNAPQIWPEVVLMLLSVALFLVGRRMSKPLVPLALLGVAVSACVQLAIFLPLYPSYDVRPMAQAIHQAQEKGVLVAHLGLYHNQYHFAGRLQKPLPEMESMAELKTWLIDHPDGYAVVYTKNMSRLQGTETLASQPYLDGAVALLDAPSALRALAIPKALDSH